MATIPLGSVAPGLGRALGTGIGESLQRGLDQLAQQKMAALAKQQQVTGLTPIFGPKAAQIFANLPPEAQKAVMYDPASFINQINQMGQGQVEQQPDFMNALSGMQQPQSEQPQPDLKQQLDTFSLLKNMGIPQEQIAQIMQEKFGQQEQAQAQPQQVQPVEQAVQQPKPRVPQQVPADFLKSPETKRREEELNIKKARESREVSKEGRAWLKPYLELGEKAKKDKRSYQALIDGVNSGNLLSGPARIALDAVGLGDFWTNLTTQIAAKEIARLGQNAAGAFGPGARITNYLEKTFQRSLATLWNTPEGIKVISTLGMLNADAQELIEQEARKIARETKGVIPFDADILARERIKDKLDAIEEKMLAIAANPAGVDFIGKGFAQKPAASSVPVGTVIRNKKTGKNERSDGSQWLEV